MGSIKALVVAVWVALALMAGAMGSVAGLQSNAKASPSLLEACLKAQSVTDQVSLRVVSEQDIRSPRTGAPRRHRWEWLIRRESDLIDTSGRHLLPDMDETVTMKYREVFTKQTFVGYNYRPAKSHGPSGALASNEPQRHWTVFFFDDASQGVFLDGYLAGSSGKRVTDLALEGTQQEVMGQEAVQGTPCTKVESRTAYGRIVLWIAETRGHLPFKVLYEKGPEDLYQDKRISEWPETPFGSIDARGRPQATAQLVGYSAVVDDVRVSKIGDVYVPVAGREKETKKWIKNGREAISEVIETRTTRTDIEISPSFAGTDAFVTDLPNGAPVNNLEDQNSGIDYVWEHGKIVPVSAEFEGKAHGVWGGRALVVTVGWAVLGLVLVAIAVLLLWRARARRGA